MAVFFIVWFCVMLGAAGIRLASEAPTPKRIAIISPSRSPAQKRIAIISHSHDDDGADDTFTFNHLPKAGGQFVIQVIRDSLSNSKSTMSVEYESDTLTSQELSDTFVVGLIRNPFHYYISLWSYNSGGEGDFRYALNRQQRDEYLGKVQASGAFGRSWGDSDDDVKRFRKWVRLVNHEEMGVLTYRFFNSYVAQPNHTSQYPLHRTARQEIQRDSSLLDRVNHGFYQAVQRQICWVHTESIVNDTRSCLEEYEAPSGRGSKVNWARFEEAVANKGHHATYHAACGTLYDQRTIDYVEKSDRHVFEAFSSYLGQCLP